MGLPHNQIKNERIKSQKGQEPGQVRNPEGTNQQSQVITWDALFLSGKSKVLLIYSAHGMWKGAFASLTGAWGSSILSHAYTKQNYNQNNNVILLAATQCHSSGLCGILPAPQLALPHMYEATTASYFCF